MGRISKLFARRQHRVRYRIAQVAMGRPRLSVFRSGRHIYAQLIDDAAQKTIASASTLEMTKSDAKVKTWNVGAAAEVGKLIAKRALEKGVKQVAFDRGGYLYHGRVKALAESARETGLEF
ncbi:MAG: 50S ribosomal protein L18 [Alphaproteobacteria bacterium]